MYLFLDQNNDVLYVGKAKDLRSRVSSYFAKSADLGDKTKALVAKVEKIQIVQAMSEMESLLLEARFVKKYDPQYNIRLRDGKSYPLIRVTVKDQYPAVVVARRTEDATSVYFGPFPNSGAMRMVLRTLRRIFPYQSVLHHDKKVCLYHHLGLCPCVSVNNSPQEKAAYTRSIHHIVDFLDGDIQKVLASLAKERESASKQENFEQAHTLQKQIDAIQLITQPVFTPFDYETNPNLRSDTLNQALADLRDVLQKNGVHITDLSRIECYDISNIQGTNPTASMVVCTNGEIDTSSYRKFKLRSLTHHKPDDFAAMREVLTRRFSHKEWPTPGLLMVDGGKGQVSAAKEILDILGSNVPLIGLAKRLETIVLPSMEEIRLSHRSPALLLLMRIRDEAHRFAITYHKKLRSASALQ